MNASRHRLLRRCALLLLIALTASGCTLFSPRRADEQSAVLNLLPAQLPQRSAHQVTLLVLPPETSPIYDTTRMAYMTRPFQVDYFRSHEWAATPAQMLRPLLVKTLMKTGYFAAVVTPPYSGDYSYVLYTDLGSMTQDFTTTPATVHLSLRCQLRNGNGRVIATREIDLRETMQEKTPYAGVVASNRATASALRQVALFVLAQMDSQ